MEPTQSSTPEPKQGPLLNDKYRSFLETLRDSGRINMFGATPHLMEAFGLERKEAMDVLKEWMEGYKSV